MSSITYCLNTSTIAPQSVPEKIRLAAEAGFGAIELWLRDVVAYARDSAGNVDSGKVADVAKRVKDHGLFVPNVIAMFGWGNASAEELPAALEQCRRQMEMAVQLGSKYIVATPPIYEGDEALIAERYRELLRIGKQVGIRPTMEYLGFCRSIYRVDQAWKIVEAANDPAATLVLDSFHTYRGGSSIDDVERLPIERVAHFHIDDAPRYVQREQQKDPDRVMLGEGVIDLRREMNWLKCQGYRGAVSLELFNPTLWEQDPRRVLSVGIERMRGLIEN